MGKVIPIRGASVAEFLREAADYAEQNKAMGVGLILIDGERSVRTNYIDPSGESSHDLVAGCRYLEHHMIKDWEEGE